MPAVDVRGYLDLTLDDRTPQDLVRTALLDLTSRFPGVNFRTGHIETLVAESVGLQVAQLIFAVNRLPGATTEILLRLFGLTRDPGAPATVTLRVETSGAYRVEIPAGMRVRVDPAGGLPPVVFTANAALVIPAGATSGTAPATAARATADPNGVAAETVLVLLDSVPVERVVTHTAVTAGRDAENQRTFLDRGVARFDRLSETLVLPKHFAAAALEDARVGRALAIDNFNSDAGSGVPGDHPGHVTVAVLGPDGANLTATPKAEIEAVLEAAAQTSLDVHLANPTVTVVNVAATVRALPGHVSATVKTAVETRIGELLDPLKWPWTAAVYRLELVGDVAGVAGVDRVETLTLNGGTADITLTGVAPLVDAGTIVATVNLP